MSIDSFIQLMQNMEYKKLFCFDPEMYKHLNGDIWMPGAFTPEAVNATLTFQLRDTDIFSPTYPKTGTLSNTICFHIYCCTCKQACVILKLIVHLKKKCLKGYSPLQDKHGS